MEKLRIKPLIILPVGEVSQKDIAKLNKNNLCVIEAKNPANVYFREAPPEETTNREKAAIALFRTVLNNNASSTYSGREIGSMFAKILIEQPEPNQINRVKEVHGK